MATKRASATAKSKRVFGQPQAAAKCSVGLYARVSTHDQKTLPLQIRAMRDYAAKRGWEIAVQIKEVGSGAVERELREMVMAAARRRQIDWCWSGDWTAGTDHSPIWSSHSKNWQISASVSCR